MYFEILDNDRLTLLQTLCDKIDLSAFYLVGGTALSLQMKLRKSYDFNFFRKVHLMKISSTIQSFNYFQMTQKLFS